jgi:hypothetical protein
LANGSLTSSTNSTTKFGFAIAAADSRRATSTKDRMTWNRGRNCGKFAEEGGSPAKVSCMSRMSALLTNLFCRKERVRVQGRWMWGQKGPSANTTPSGSTSPIETRQVL